MNNIVVRALNIVCGFLMPRFNRQDQVWIQRGLLSLAGIDEFDFCNETLTIDSYDDAQSALACLNEHESVRKKKGVYYTPSDVVRFIVANTAKASCGALSSETIQTGDLPTEFSEDFCFQKTVFEPTCGSGEFLLETLEQKLVLLSHTHPDVSKEEIECVVQTIYGNDINSDSIIISKLRLFLYIANSYGVDYCKDLPSILNSNFTTYDYVTSHPNTDECYDIIVGNPPYVEDHKSGLALEDHYGNIYANVLLNAASQLREGGSMGFIIPISYSSTPRMKKLRDKLMNVVQEQYILCYSDRPDCLFDSVHQKLCILICKNTSDTRTLYTSNYQYWYQEERKHLFSNTRVVLNSFLRDDCVPKLGTALDVSIYQKLMDQTYPTVYSISRSGLHSIYINRRETFWIKAFRREIIHPEYKVFSFDTKEEADYCYCLLNSTLFWWYWICVSDCWHVSKELNGFRAPQISDATLFSDLAEALDEKLESTKEYVGTKQVDYEYKHRACLDEIHAIDDVINSIFGLTKEESDYIKSFALRYRVGGGAISNECD